MKNSCQTIRKFLNTLSWWKNDIWFHVQCLMQVAKSSVFNAMLGDGDTRNLVTDMKAEILRPFLHFLYTAELSPEDLEKYSGNLMAAAHMYEIAALKTTCEAYITKHVTEDTAVSFLKLAMDCDSKTIKLAAMKVITKDFKQFVLRDDYQSLKENNPSIIAKALEAMTISAQERTLQNPAAREPSAQNNFVEVATPTAPATATPAGGVFGPATAPLFVHPTAVTCGGSFGSTTPLVTAVPSGGLFGPTTPPVFGHPTAKSSGGFFGQTTQPLFGQPTATPLPGVFGQPTPTPSNDPSSSNHVSSSCAFSSPSHQLLSPQFVFPRAKLDAFARGDSSPPSSSQQSPGFVFPPNLFGAFSSSSHQSPGFLFPSSASSPFGSSSSCQPTGIALPAVNPCPPAFGEVLKTPSRPVERSISVKDASANRSWTNRRK